MAQARHKLQFLPDYRYKKVWKDGERVLLTLEENLPRFGTVSPGSRRLDRYFQALGRLWRRRWESRLLPAAKAVQPNRPWSASLAYEITRSDDRYLSLWWEAAEDTGCERLRKVREGLVWDIEGSSFLTLPDLLGSRGWRNRVLAQVAAHIDTQLAAGTALYYEDWPRLCRRQLSPHNFWLTDEGLMVFYPMYTIAPALEGFPTFAMEAEG